MYLVLRRPIHSAFRTLISVRRASTNANMSSQNRIIRRDTRDELPEPVDPPIKFAHLRGDNRVIAYTEEGDRNPDRPLIICLHGAPGSVRDFRYIAPVFAKDFNVLRIDIPGHGSSPSTTCPKLDNESIGETILEALDSLGYSSSTKITVVGHSLGGGIAFHLAAKHSDRIASLVLINSLGARPHKGISPTYLKIDLTKLLLDIPLVGEYVFLPLLKLMYVHVLGFSKNTTASEIRASHDRLKTLDFELVQNNIKRLRQNSVPTVVAYSTNDPLVETKLSEDLSEQLTPGARIISSKGGHYLQKAQAVTIAETTKNCLLDGDVSKSS